jgi:glutamate 5-kinase
MPETRKLYLANVRSVVIKLGSQLLTTRDGRLDDAYLRNIAGQAVALRERGIQTTIVSSGAISAGLGELNLPTRPKDLALLQAVAAVGQRRLMDAWGAAFAPHQIPVGQILLTREDMDRRARFLNLRNTIHALQQMNGVAIINENDTISTDELVKISFGDNDILAALVAHVLRADLLVLMSVVDGVLDETGQPVRLVDRIDQAQQLVRKEKSQLGKGGMDSKLQAARMVTDAGEAMCVVDGRMPDVLARLLDCDLVGTLFAPSPRKRPSRSRWIGAARPVGAILIDDGAVRALVEKNKSLLAAGITGVDGTFEKGDLVSIQTHQGVEIARGLSNYPAPLITQIRGLKTSEVRTQIGEAAYDEVIHRDNLVITTSQSRPKAVTGPSSNKP